MLKFIIYISVFTLCAVGLCDLLHSIWINLIKPKNRPESLFIVYLDGLDDYSVLLEVYENIRWYGDKHFGRVVAVYDNDCDLFLREYFEDKGITFCAANNLEVGVLNEYRAKRYR